MADERGLEATQLSEGSRAGKAADNTRVTSTIPLADVTQVRGAARGFVDGVHDVDVASVGQAGRSDGSGDGIKVVALKKDPGIAVNVKGMAANVLEVVVDAVEQVLAASGVRRSHVRGATRDVM